MNKFYKISIAFLAAFCILTLFVMTVDVQAIGPQGSSVGLATINGAANKLFGSHRFFYILTEAIGYFALLVCVAFGCVGAVQLFKGKSLEAVDKKIIALGIFYIIVIAIYFAFSKIPINYRPMLESDLSLEPSYPSSHSVLALCVYITACLQDAFKKLFGKYEKTCRILIGMVLPVIMLVGRLLSGIHWFTDILGAALLSMALVCAYRGSIDRYL